MDTLSVAVSAGFKPAYLRLAPLFRQRSGVELRTAWVPSVELAARLERPERDDAVIAARVAVAELVDRGALDAGSIVDLAFTGIGVAVPAGHAVPDISSSSALRRALLAATSIGRSSGPSGDTMLRLFETLGIAQDVTPKLITTRSSVAELLSSGRADLGFQQISELLPMTDIQYVGPLPSPLQHITVFSGAITQDAGNSATARHMLDFFASKQAHPVIRKTGMEPCGS